MKTHNLIIYHCQSCGAIAHRDPERNVPLCCGKPMLKAAVETVSGDDPPEGGPRNTESGRPSAPVRTKPR